MSDSTMPNSIMSDQIAIQATVLNANKQRPLSNQTVVLTIVMVLLAATTAAVFSQIELYDHVLAFFNRFDGGRVSHTVLEGRKMHADLIATITACLIAVVAMKFGVRAVIRAAERSDRA